MAERKSPWFLARESDGGGRLSYSLSAVDECDSSGWRPLVGARIPEGMTVEFRGSSGPLYVDWTVLYVFDDETNQFLDRMYRLVEMLEDLSGQDVSLINDSIFYPLEELLGELLEAEPPPEPSD